MTEGKPSAHILAFALPMLVGSMFQQMYNVVDSIIVGQFIGPDALAAIGTAYPPMFLCLSFLIGLGVGISVVISQLFGAGEYDSLKKALSTTLIFAAGMTAAVTAAALALVRPILRWMNTPDEIMADASDYLTVIFAGIVFMVLYNCYVACLRGIGDSKTPLYFLIVSSVINVILDLVFVIGLGWGVKARPLPR
jgi:putative MATE family efflux protein